MTDLENTQRQTKSKVLLIGDSCVDEYRIGIVDRLSPEAPVPVIKLVDRSTVPGMAANVRLNLLALDLDVDFVTNKKTITKTRYIDSRSKQHLLRVDDEPEIDQWDGNLPKNIEEYEAVIISDYNKGFLSYKDIKHLIEHAMCPIFIDTKKTELEEFSADNVFVKINELEYKSARSLPRNLIVTLGERGARLKTPDSDTTYPTRRVEVVDVCGCGDTFLSTLSCTYILTDDIDLAITTANFASSITVQHSGNYAPKFKEILNARH